MKYEIQLDNEGYLIGFAARSAKVGDAVSFVSKEFLSSEDGMLLISRLEELTRLFFPTDSKKLILASQIDRMVVLIDKSSKATVYINEPDISIRFQSKRDVEAGEGVLIDDIADITDLEFQGLQIPNDHGWIVLFSSGWRKGLVFDFTPLSPTAGIESQSFSRVLGAAFSYVAFQERFTLTEVEWDELISQGWFPFTGISTGLLNGMLLRLREGFQVDDLLPEIILDVEKNIPSIKKMISFSKKFDGHRELLNEAIDSYQTGNIKVASAALISRIEGILRSHYAALGGKKPNQDTFIATATIDTGNNRHTESLLMPTYFNKYLTKSFFASEDFTDPGSVSLVTRHSVSHGVVPEEKLDQKSFVIALLTLWQLSFLMVD